MKKIYNFINGTQMLHLFGTYEQVYFHNHPSILLIIIEKRIRIWCNDRERRRVRCMRC
jgi:hypothetical protein